ncbi:hypothetical protein A9Z40_00750 [Microbacterium arborescens]|uniref:Uncharacterized protein n=1 Tax=Microbacterium arborescens TaxID=33883 RepID=A0ABX2WNC9_9MICO|nr:MULTISPECIES: hypothetical protein [Microbacterium]OAZ45675.1 hypothetical protein A9Z40_00750 [Microbacterium arborescens]QCR40800.1 hypothetical protein C1N74_10515 [Microbacterium sp. SGAir0570]
MRRIHYGTGVVLTTDDVADVLLRLSVALANLSHTERVTIPVASGDSSNISVDLILGPGIAVMSEPAPWYGDEPDFSTGATLLRMHPHYPYRRPADRPQPMTPIEVDNWDPDLEGY